MTFEPQSRPRESLPEIPGYRIEGVIGRGSTGVVYRAKQLAVDRAVALKILHPELAGKGNAIRRLQREARTTARLTHPSIVSAIDMGETRGRWWYAMELVEGESLAQRLRTKGRLTEREALRLLIPLVEALQHAHEHGVVHRDIKPANILVDGEGWPHLVDLGLALVEDDPAITRHGGTMGTPHYISPEQARNPATVDIRSDIWSLGATFYHAVCGRPPFEGASVAEILSGVLYSRVQDPNELAPNLSRGHALVLRKCLSRAPERRYQTPKELLADLELLRERRDVKIRASMLDPVAGDDGRSRRWLWASAAALILGVSAWAIWWPDDTTTPANSSASDSARLEPWPELERIAAKGRRADSELASAITEVRQLQPVPERYRARYDEVVAGLVGAYHNAVDAFGTAWRAEVDAALNARDYVRAASLASRGELEARLRASFAPSAGQLAELFERLRDDECRSRIAARVALEASTDVAAARKLVAERVSPSLADFLSRSAFASARVEALRARDAFQAELTRAPRRLSVDDAARVAQEVVAAFAPLIADLDERWRTLDGELEALVDARAAEIEARVRARDFEGAADAALASLFAAELEARGLARTEFVDEVSRGALDELDARMHALAEIQSRIEEEDAQTWAFITDREVSEAWKARDYALVRRRWESGRNEPWTARIAPRIELEVQWADLLDEVLRRAADEVRGSKGKTLALLIGTIQTEGVVTAAEDPIGQGFGFRAGATANERRLALRALDDPKAALLGTDAVERLAGLVPVAGERDDPKKRFLRLLFRYREGDVQGALAALRSGALPREEFPALVAEIEQRLRQSATSFAEERSARSTEAKTLYNLISRTRTAEHDKDLVVKRIDDLLTRLGDLDYVRGLRPELEAWRAELVAPAAPVDVGTLAERFGGAELSLIDGRARVTWRMSSTADVAFSAGDWILAADGWRASDLRARDDLFNAERWPHVSLAPFANFDREVECEIEFEQPKSSGPARLCVVTVAGWHVALAGAQLPGGPGRWRASSGDLRELVDEVFGRRGREFEVLKSDAIHVLRVRLTHKRGRIEVTLDGKPLGQESGLRPAETAANAEIAVRSLEAVRLIRVTVAFAAR
ncbi:MAG: protein kinase [Planctomycetes bacterium]|nr:protein kinase [Planctomycetota bacterium]